MVNVDSRFRIEPRRNNGGALEIADILVICTVCSRTQPSDVKAAVLAAFKAGATRVVLSRKHKEMKLTNLAGAGDALREIGVWPPFWLRYDFNLGC